MMNSAERCYEHSLPQNNMDKFGADIINEEDSSTADKLRHQRIKRGECPKCQRKTHKVSRFRNKREPLTSGEVLNGICLRCNPLTKSPSATAPAKAAPVPVPDTFVCDDDVTVVSEITLDTCIEQQAPKRSNRYNSKPFESVSEETPMTNFRSNDQVPTNIIGSQRGRDRERGKPLMSRLAENEDDEEEDKKWLAAQRQQKFHPMSRELYKYNSERSLGIESTGTDNSENSSEHFRPPKLHPLSRDMYASTSERSLSVSMNESDSSDISKIRKQASDRSVSLHESQNSSTNCSDSGDVQRISLMKREPSTNSLSGVSSGSGYSSDGQRIKSLLQHSTSLMTKAEYSKKQAKEDKCLQRHDHRRNTTSSDSFKPASVKPAENKRPNRFSLHQVEPNRLGLTAKDLPLAKLRASDPTADRTYDYEMEMSNSKNWNSFDILKDAAAEANGEKFSLADFAKETEAELSKVATEKTTTLTDELSMMMSFLSLPPSSTDEAKMAKHIRKRKGGKFSTSINQIIASIKDIPIVIQCVKTRSTAICTERAFQTLFLLATNPEQEGHLAREKILSNDGMETLISALWEHVDNAQVLRAIFLSLWALLDFDLSSEVNQNASLKKIQDCSVVEGMLTVMQMHATDIPIQESGFDIIGRLAGLLPSDISAFETAVSVIVTIIKDMDIKSRAYSSGIFALNSLCQSSDKRKDDVARCVDCFKAVCRVILSKTVSLRRREVACQVYWVVTSDRSAVSVLSKKFELAAVIIDALQGFSLTEMAACSTFLEVACGTLANLALDTGNHTKLVDIGVVQVLCDAVHMHISSEDVTLVCCTAFANLSASIETRETISAQGAINALFACIKAEFNCPEVDREAFRALCNLSDSSSEVKQIISCDLDTIIATYNLYEEDRYIQSTTCSMLERLSGDTICRKGMIAFPDIFDILARIIQANPSKKTIEMHACSLLRNLSLEESVESRARFSTSFVPFVMMAMAAHVDSKELLENACFFLSTVGSTQPEGFHELCTEDGINCIINAIRTNNSSASLLEACCGALRAAINDSDNHKNLCLSAGAIDAIICLIMVHPHDTLLLENALNVLVSLSCQKKCVSALANSGGIDTVVETMRSNPTCSVIINNGSRFISNMVETDPEYANIAVPAVAPVLSCLKEQINNEKLIEELCRSLHCLVLVSENCADRVISADGVAVIETAMKRNESNTVITQECDVLLQILNKIR